MLEEQLDDPLRGFVGAGVTGGRGVLLEAPGCAQRLVERRSVTVGPAVTVPAAVWPLPGDDGLGQSLGAIVSCESETRTRAERVAMDAGMRTRQPVDQPWRNPQTADDPGQDMLGGGRNAGVAGRCFELGQRDQPPVCTGPLTVRVAPEPAVLVLPREQRGHPRPGRDGCPLRRRAFSQQIASGQVPDRRLLRRDQPGHRPGRPGCSRWLRGGRVALAGRCGQSPPARDRRGLSHDNPEPAGRVRRL